MSESTHIPNVNVYELKLLGGDFSHEGNSATGDTGEGCPPIRIGSKVAVTYGEDTKLFLSLYNVSFHRKIYDPGQIKAELLIQTTDDLSVTTLSNMLSGREIELSVAEEKVAENYFINEISPRFENGPGDVKFIYVTLDILSKDAILGFNKFSKAHLGQALIGDIVKTYAGLASVPVRPLNESVLQKMAYKDASGNQVELIQPYLVQYNESFRSFLRRVANRCGEVFYFEDGKLCFGLKSNGTSTEIDNARRVSFQNVAKGPFSTSEFAVSDYARDTVKEGTEVDVAATTTVPAHKNMSYEPGDGKVLSDPISKRTDVFPSTSLNYNSEIASEDHYMLLYKDKFAHDSGDDLWLGDLEARAVGWISLVLNSTSLLEAVATFAEQEILNGLKLIDKAGKITDAGNEKIKEEALDSNKDYAVLFSKVDNEVSHWVTLKYYTDVRTNEEAQARKMVCIDMGESFRNVKLGDKITISQDSGTTYVVVQIDMDSASQSQKFYAIPMTSGGVFYPPLLPDQPFRASGPQPAIVIDAGDPAGQGRVRIRYPWQQSTKPEKDAEDTAKNDMDKAKKALEKYAKISKDDNGDEKITKKSGVSDSDFKTYKDDYENKKGLWAAAKLATTVAEAATPWIRMSTPSATPGGGMYFQPEKDDEVMVDFENGNIERPYVTGSLYSKNIPAPSRGNRVIMSKNGHTIKMDDPDDATLILNSTVPGVKFLNTFGVNCPSLEGKAASALGGIELTDKPGLYSIKMSSHDREIQISSPLGDIKMNALTGITIDAPNGDITMTGKNINLYAYNKVNVNSGRNIMISGGKHLGGYFSGSFDLKNVGYQAGVSAVKAAMTFFDFSLLRAILEVFIRPIDGTMLFKSYRYMQLEAGPGVTADDASNYSSRPLDRRSKAGNSKIICDVMRVVNRKVDTFVNQFVQAFNELREAANAITDDLFGDATTDIITRPANKADLVKQIFKLDPADHTQVRASVAAFLNNRDKFRFGASINVNQARENGAKIITLAKKAYAIKEFSGKIDHLFDLINRRYDDFHLNTEAPNILKTEPAIMGAAPGPGAPELYTNFIKVLDDFKNNPNLALFQNELTADNFTEWKKFIKRRLAHKVIETCRTNNNIIEGCKIPPAAYGTVRTLDANGIATSNDTSPGNTNQPFSDADWPKYVAGVKVTTSDEDNDFLQGMEMGAEFMIMKHVMPLEWWVWSPTTDGKILFSDKENKTIRFNNGATESYDNPDRLFAPNERSVQQAITF